MNKTLIISATIIICVAILGGIYYSVEMNKQKATKRQQGIPIFFLKGLGMLYL